MSKPKKRKRAASGSRWENKVGYSRAVRSGNTIHISGTTATNEQGKIVAAGDPYGQTKQAIENIKSALQQLVPGSKT